MNQILTHYKLLLKNLKITAMSWKQIMMERSGRSSYSDGSEMKKLLSEAKEMLAEAIEILEEVCEHSKEKEEYSPRRSWRIDEK